MKNYITFLDPGGINYVIIVGATVEKPQTLENKGDYLLEILESLEFPSVEWKTFRNDPFVRSRRIYSLALTSQTS